MRIQRLLVVLTLVNLLALIFTLTAMRPAVAQGAAPVLRGRSLEIVDDQGRVRASLSVLLPGRRRPVTILRRPCCSG